MKWNEKLTTKYKPLIALTLTGLFKSLSQSRGFPCSFTVCKIKCVCLCVLSTVSMRKRRPPGNSARNARTEWRKYEASRRPVLALLAKRYREHSLTNLIVFHGEIVLTIIQATVKSLYFLIFITHLSFYSTLLIFVSPQLFCYFNFLCHLSNHISLSSETVEGKCFPEIDLNAVCR